MAKSQGWFSQHMESKQAPVGSAQFIRIGREHHQAGRLAEAETSYRQALAIEPRNAIALQLLGTLAYQVGQREFAVQLFEQALAAEPASAEALNNRGLALLELKRVGEALSSFEQALLLKYDYAEAWNNRGLAHCELEDFENALASYDRALAIRPDYGKAAYNRANALFQLCRYREALAAYERALEINPLFAQALTNRGAALHKLRRYKEALAAYDDALAIEPDSPETLSNRGATLLELNRNEDALANCDRALAIVPRLSGALNNRGLALHKLKRHHEALASFDQALAGDPNNAQSYLNRARVLFDRGEVGKAVESCRIALRLQPRNAETHSELLLMMQCLPGITPQDMVTEQERYAEFHEQPLRTTWRQHRNDRNPERRLRIGYMSGDFRNHSLAFFIEPILSGHDKSHVESYCYYNNADHDLHTKRIAAHADHWIECAGMTDEQLAERIRSDRIDILVDLSGHTARNRLLVFARKPAPVQATWMGYIGSTGLSAMDYRITDPRMDPPGLTERYHSETLIRLPESWAAYQPEPGCPRVNELPALGGKTFTFGSLNTLAKMNPAVIALWARLLKALPDAKLMLGDMGERPTRDRFLSEFGNEGIGPERLLLHPPVPILDYLALYHQIDLCLDPFPYTGGITTAHAMWMGVPVITLAGVQSVSRHGVAFLYRVGLPDFIAHSEAEYVERAVRVARDLPSLSRIRRSLRERMTTYSACDPQVITRHLENAYRSMWRRWCEST